MKKKRTQKSPVSISPNKADRHSTNSGNAITNPVWFVADDEKLYLLGG
jgi:hypothetical protein